MIFVAGASGFLGQHLVQYLCEKHYKVLASFNSTKPEFQHPNISYIQVNFLNQTQVEDLFKTYKIQFVVDLAARIDYSGTKASEIIDYNTEMTSNLVNSALGYNLSYLKISSIAALGESPDQNIPINEDSEWNSKSKHGNYSISKKMSEMEVWRAAAEGLDVMVLYPGVIVGVENNEESESMSDQFTRNICKKQKYYTYGRSLYVDVLDVCKAIENCLSSWIPDGYFIIGQENITFRELLNTTADVFDYPRPYKELKKWMAKTFHLSYNFKNIISGQKGFLTRETVSMLFRETRYQTTKFLLAYPDFQYTALEDSFERIKKQLNK